MSSFENVILENLEEFAGKMANLIVLQKVTLDSFSKEMSACIEYASNLENSAFGSDFPISVQRMHYYCLETGMLKTYGYNKVTVDVQQNRLFEHKNKQYQWLLAEGYEIYAKYIETIYACAGYCDQSLWLMSDFGNTPYLAKIERELSFYKLQASKKKETPRSILTQLRKVLPHIEYVEKNNKCKKNVQLTLSLIQNLRHIIVHCGGEVKDKEAFIKKVLQESCLFNDKTQNNEYRDFINYYFGDGDYGNLILLLEQDVSVNSGIKTYIDRLGSLLNFLVSHAAMITMELHKHITKS